jgi:hypothetical protein
VKPDNVSDQEWDAIQRAQNILTEYFQNCAIFINWVAEDKQTKRIEILAGNGFALKHHINCWSDGDFDPDCEVLFSDEDEDDEDDKKKKSHK